MKKPVVFFTIADNDNMRFATMCRNSLAKFHPDIPFKIIGGDDLKTRLEADKNFFYRATPIIASELIGEYELVIKIDADSIVTGNLDYILNTKDYDVGTVINWNRVDPERFGLVAGWGILPPEYMNCGFVAMRNEKFIEHWKNVCFSAQFDRMQYREQDLLNALVYFGNYNVRCFDHGDGPAKYSAWHGLIAKSEWLRANVVGEDIVISKGEDGFPKTDVLLKIIHWAGGKDEKKMNYRTKFQEDVIKRLDYLVK